MRFRVRDPIELEQRPRRAFRLSKSFEASAPRTRRTLDVHDAFGIGLDGRRRVIYRDLVIDVDPGDVVFVTGESGGGKSLILKDLAMRLRDVKGFRPVVDLREIEAKPGELVIEGVGRDTKEAIELLSSVGLGEAFVFLRRYKELSDGQKFRYLLAKALDRRPRTLVADEFCSNLDRTTAKVIAYLVQKRARANGTTLVLATAHDDLIEDLGPDVLVRKRIGSAAEVHYDLPRPKTCSLMRSLEVSRGTLWDYKELAEFHYRGKKPPFIEAIFTARIGDELAGVIVYTSVYPHLRAREAAFPFLKELKKELGRKRYVKWLNEHFTRISRVVVHPKFRGIGLGAELVRRTMPLVGKAYVEALAVMARYNPFFERAGMRRIEVGKEPREDVKAARELLKDLGADDFVIRDRRLFVEWYRSLRPKEKRKVLKAPRIAVGCFPIRRPLGVSKLGERLARAISPPEYLIWRNLELGSELPEPVSPRPSSPQGQAS
ncbi:MAG: GNAT family N-acetyltransferase [Nitrososphaeria archaeon]|nr:GNAT family N-acetyltransferase [Nitrososphaeria archaeon]